MNIIVKKPYSEVLAENLTQWVMGGVASEEIEYLKAKLGIESILINLSKTVIVYAVAILLRTLIPTLIMHFSYVVIRKFSQGLHAKSSMVCTLVSIVMFVMVPYTIQGIIIGRGQVFLIGVVVTCLFYLYAPADTEKSPIINSRIRKELRWKSVMASISIFGLVLLVDPAVRGLILTGITMQVIMILPITYKLLGRSYNNYEEYEKAN